MLTNYLVRFNQTLTEFQDKFPRAQWSEDFKKNLINDFCFFSARIEDEKLQYGDTIKFLNDQLVKKGKMKSLMEVANHKDVLSSVINRFETFKLTEESIKGIHKDLMSDEIAWEVDFKPHLVGQYGNIPTVGYREPLYRNKEYVPHFNLDMAVSSYLDVFNGKFNRIDNSKDETHILTVLAFFHNIFLNKLHPFADGNGRVCRMIMGTMLMKYNCPPIFVRITSDEDRIEYISRIIKCEEENSDIPLIEFLAIGMSDYMHERLGFKN